MYQVELCAGSGMLGLAVKLAFGGRVRTVAYCEREGYAAATLVARMADQALDRAPIWDDVNTLCEREFIEYIQGFHPLIVSGGYPCQPFSCAGKRAGENDERHIWPGIARFVGEVKPEVCFFENVSGHLTLGFDTVCGDLERMGYRLASGLFSAEEVGANHKRERLFVLAVRADGGRGVLRESSGGDGQPDGRGAAVADVQHAERGSVPIEAGRKAWKGSANLADAERESRGAEQFTGTGGGPGGGAGNGSVFGAAGPGLADANEHDGRSEFQSGCAGKCRGGGFTGECEKLGDSAGDDEWGSAVCGAYGERIETGGSGVGLDDASWRGLGGCGLSVRRGGSHETTGHAGESGKKLAESARAGLEKRGCECGNFGKEFADVGGGGLPLFAPGPGDVEGWRNILNIAPHIAPATERELCRTPDGLAYRLDTDRLRLTGNGVVPLAAAYAFVSLWAALESGYGV